MWIICILKLVIFTMYLLYLVKISEYVPKEIREVAKKNENER